jgi:hypothetical protein
LPAFREDRKMLDPKILTEGFSAPKTAIGWHYTNHFDQAAEIYNKYANPFWYYEWIVDELLKIDHSSVVPLFELMSADANNKRIIGLRHDIDMDPETGLRCARYLAMKGLCGSFYLLHTNPYYGVFYGDYFVRNPQLVEWVKRFIVSGCELGLHNDCLRIYKDYNQDGAEVLKQELEWLRSLGAVIRGTVSHNSGPVYGAENYEIFSGHKLWDREVLTADMKAIPLGSLSEETLGLSYEGTFSRPKPCINEEQAKQFFSDQSSCDVHSKEWMKTFLLNNPTCDYMIDFQFWLLGKDKWIISGIHGGYSTFEWNVDLTHVLETMRILPTGSRSVLVIHPEYVRGNR